MFFCVCTDDGKNIIVQINSEKEKELTAQNILNQYCPGKNSLWLRTENYAYAFNSNDHPLIDYPNLISNDRPNLWSVPSVTLFTFSDIDPNSKILFLLPKHTTDQKIPRITTIISQSDFQSNLSRLYTIIEESFLASVKVNSISANDQEINKDSPIKDLFDKAKSGNEVSVSLDISDACLSKLNFRVNVINEIIYSENNYINDLFVIVQVWRSVFQNHAYLGELDFRTLFNDFPMILNYHKEFYSLLKQKGNGYATEFARLFLEYIPFFKVSVNYITNYPSINQLLKEKKNDPEFQSVCDQISLTLKGRDLASYLITPVQRLPRYSLFMREMSKGTPINHPDYIFLKAAQSAMIDLNKEIDEKTAFIETQKVLSDLQMRNYNDFSYVSPNRRVLKQFDTIIKSRNLTGRFIVCNDYVFLIDSFDLYCRYKFPSDAVPIVILDDGLSVRIVSPDADDTYENGNDITFSSKEDLNDFLSLVKIANGNNE